MHREHRLQLLSLVMFELIRVLLECFLGSCLLGLLIAGLGFQPQLVKNGLGKREVEPRAKIPMLCFEGEHGELSPVLTEKHESLS